MVKRVTTQTLPDILRYSNKNRPLSEILAEAIRAGLPVVVPAEGNHREIEDSSAIDLSLSREQATDPVPVPHPGTSYAGLTPHQRHDFLSWCHRPERPAPLAYQQLLLANLEAQLLEEEQRHSAILLMTQLGSEASWANHHALHRAFILACWLQQEGQRLSDWISAHPLPAELMGVALGIQAIIGAHLTAPELGAVVTSWKLGDRLPADLLKLRLDSLTAILGQPPLAHSLTLLGPSATMPRPWRTSHRGLHLLIPQPDLRPLLEPPLRDLLSVADSVGELDGSDNAPAGMLHSLAAHQDASQEINQGAVSPEESTQPSLEELGWRLILEFGSNRSEYFDYVLTQAQKLSGFTQLMDEDRRMVYRIIFRKSEMRRFWRIWDYVHGWTSTRVYLNGVELEKWKVWPYSHYLR